VDGGSKANDKSSRENYYRGGRSYDGDKQKRSNLETNQKSASGELLDLRTEP
jgi:hypothetical protein